MGTEAQRERFATGSLVEASRLAARSAAVSRIKFGDHTACFLCPTPNAGTSKAVKPWQVVDVEREVADLTARGVTFEEY